MTHPARRLWQLTEPVHALTYFAPEAHRAFEDLGLRGFWRGYFAGRSAPLGPVGPGIVTATFFGFHPDFVARALPSIWSTASPEAALQVRLAGIDAALERTLGDLDRAEVASVAEPLRDALERCEPAGRPLFAANAALPWPDEPRRSLWHAATLLREHRGDGHVAALVAADVDPCEAHVSQTAASGASPDTLKPYRGWSDDDWAAGVERLRARGWLDGDAFTPQGAEARAAIEATTDHLAAVVVEHLGERRFETVLAQLRPLTSQLLRAGDIPYPNPIGLGPPA